MRMHTRTLMHIHTHAHTRIFGLTRAYSQAHTLTRIHISHTLTYSVTHTLTPILSHTCACKHTRTYSYYTHRSILTTQHTHLILSHAHTLTHAHTHILTTHTLTLTLSHTHIHTRMHTRVHTRESPRVAGRGVCALGGWSGPWTAGTGFRLERKGVVAVNRAEPQRQLDLELAGVQPLPGRSPSPWTPRPQTPVQQLLCCPHGSIYSDKDSAAGGKQTQRR